MPFSEFDEETQALIVAALYAARLELDNADSWTTARRGETTSKLTRQLLAAAEAGERNQDALMKAALAGIER
jgi:hypothetical protein